MSQHYFKGNIVITGGDNPIRESGHIAIHDHLLVFHNDERRLEFSIASLDIRYGGTGNKMVFMSEDAHPDVVLHCMDFSFLKMDNFKNHEFAQNVLSGKRKHHNVFLATLMLLAFLVIVPCYLVFIERDIVAGFVADQVSIETEQKIGDFLFDMQFAKDPNLIKDEDVLADLNKLAGPLLVLGRAKGYDFDLHILNSPETNAFAMPGGHMIILTGLINQSDRPEELLGVLGHEMAHVTQRHSLKQWIADLSGRVLLGLLASGGGDLVYMVGDQARYFLDQSYSRTHETEADEVGVRYLQEAKIDPSGLVSFFEKLSKEQTMMNNDVIELLSTHPAPEHRVETLEKMIKSKKILYRKPDISYDDFKKKILSLSDQTKTEETKTEQQQ